MVRKTYLNNFGYTCKYIACITPSLAAIVYAGAFSEDIYNGWYLTLVHDTRGFYSNVHLITLPADEKSKTMLGRQRGRVVSASDSQSGGPGFESRSGHLLDLCSVVPSLNSRPRL